MKATINGIEYSGTPEEILVIVKGLKDTPTTWTTTVPWVITSPYYYQARGTTCEHYTGNSTPPTTL